MFAFGLCLSAPTYVTTSTLVLEYSSRRWPRCCFRYWRFLSFCVECARNVRTRSILLSLRTRRLFGGRHIFCFLILILIRFNVTTYYLRIECSCKVTSNLTDIFPNAWARARGVCYSQCSDYGTSTLWYCCKPRTEMSLLSTVRSTYAL